MHQGTSLHIERVNLANTKQRNLSQITKLDLGRLRIVIGIQPETKETPKNGYRRCDGEYALCQQPSNIKNRLFSCITPAKPFQNKIRRSSIVASFSAHRSTSTGHPHVANCSRLQWLGDLERED